jgi:hypothetical protein
MANGVSITGRSILEQFPDLTDFVIKENQSSTPPPEAEEIPMPSVPEINEMVLEKLMSNARVIDDNNSILGHIQILNGSDTIPNGSDRDSIQEMFHQTTSNNETSAPTSPLKRTKSAAHISPIKTGTEFLEHARRNTPPRLVLDGKTEKTEIDSENPISTPRRRSLSVSSNPNLMAQTAPSSPTLVNMSNEEKALDESVVKMRTEELKMRMPYFLKLSESNFFSMFSPERAAKELSGCLKENPRDFPLIVDIVSKLRSINKKDSVKAKLHEVLAHVLLNVEGTQFIYVYFDKSGQEENKDAFAKTVVKIVDKNKKQFDFMQSLSRVTELELPKQKVQSLFRETNLSSTLCKAYGSYLWGKQMKELDGLIVKELRRFKPEDLLLDRNLLMEIVKKQNPNFNHLSIQDQKKLEEAQLNSNVINFQKFAEAIISHIYLLKVSGSLQELLQMRRHYIISFLKAQTDNKVHLSSNNNNVEDQEIQNEVSDPDERSKIYICELIFLRIINPHLLALVDANKEPEKYRILVQLTKVIQKIANQVPFEEKDGIYIKCNELLDFIIEQGWHEEFLEKYTVPKQLRQKTS